MDKEDTNIVNTPISERTEGEDKFPPFKIIFIEVGGMTDPSLHTPFPFLL